MSDLQQTIDGYLAAWNTLDATQRATAMQAVIADDCYYADAHLPDALVGKELHDRFVTQFRDKFPGFSLHLASPAQEHHGYFRFGWQMLKPDNSVFVKGMYFGEINSQSKICKIIGFVD